MSKELAAGGSGDDGSEQILTSLVSSTSLGDGIDASMLKRTLTSHSASAYDSSPDSPDSSAPTMEEIVERRGALKWLPEHNCHSDLEYSMYFFIIGSIFATIMPAIPLMTYDELDEFGVHNHSIAYEVHTMTYSLLIICGAFYTLGSYALKRAVEIPARKPLMACFSHTRTDELLGSWCFLLGTIVTFPILIVLTVMDHRSAQYWVGTMFIALAILICAVFCYSCYPSVMSKRKEILRPVLVKLGCTISCSSSSDTCPYDGHLANDLLICAWAFFLGCAASTLLSFMLFVYAVVETNETAMFDFGTTFFDMGVFTVGGAYFVAGAYPAPEKNENLHARHDSRMMEL